MSEKYKIFEPDKPYFITITVVDWIDVFIRKKYKLMILESLKYCQRNKGLEIFGWCLMSSHLHMIIRATGDYRLNEIMRDFKKYTSRRILEELSNDVSESRKEWMLRRFRYEGKFLKRISVYKFWQDGMHPQIILAPETFYQKLDYIHENPVKEMIVENPEDYYFSSARNYSGRSYLLEIIMESLELKTI